MLKNGTKYDKITLLKELLAKSNIKFIPMCYSKQVRNCISKYLLLFIPSVPSVQGMNTFFYLEDQAAARALKDLDKKVTLSWILPDVQQPASPDRDA